MTKVINLLTESIINPVVDNLIDNLEMAGVYFAVVERNKKYIIVYEFDTPNVPDTAMKDMRKLASIFTTNDKVRDDMVMYGLTIGGYYKGN